MSPEPSPEPTNNLPTREVNIHLQAPESESEDEDQDLSGYQPLSQYPGEGLTTHVDYYGDEEEDDISLPVDNHVPRRITSNDVAPETIEVWSSQNHSSSIPMDADKIDQVKSAMASFTLPTSHIPEWANTSVEEELKEKLINRIKQIQTCKD